MSTPKKKQGFQPRRGGFSKDMWARWLRELNEPHPHAAHLAEGIRAQRERFEFEYPTPDDRGENAR